jgi:hypothetical protein
LLQKTQHDGLTATEVETIVSKSRDAEKGVSRRGAPVTHKRFTTSRAHVSFTFRKKEVTTEDILAAIEEVRSQLLGDSQSPAPTLAG